MICAGCKKEKKVRKLPYFCNCGTRTNADGSCVITLKTPVKGSWQTPARFNYELEKPTDLPKQVEKWLNSFNSGE